MYIYKVYKTIKEIDKDIKLNKLKEGCIFAYNKHLYRMFDGKIYQRISYFEYDNNSLKKSVERIADLVYEAGDIIKIIEKY